MPYTAPAPGLRTYAALGEVTFCPRHSHGGTTGAPLKTAPPCELVGNTDGPKLSGFTPRPWKNAFPTYPLTGTKFVPWCGGVAGQISIHVATPAVAGKAG